MIYVIAYLWFGFVVASLFAASEFTLRLRWWHIVFWPLLPVGYGLVTLGFWMAQDRR